MLSWKLWGSGEFVSKRKLFHVFFFLFSHLPTPFHDIYHNTHVIQHNTILTTNSGQKRLKPSNSKKNTDLKNPVVACFSAICKEILQN